jgi:hypothetical protein
MAATLTYQYSVRDKAGKIVQGKIEADSPAAVASKLRGMGYAPVSITQANAGMQKELTLPGFGKKKVKLKELAVFSRQFATMINSGLSLLRCCVFPNISLPVTGPVRLPSIMSVNSPWKGGPIYFQYLQSKKYLSRAPAVAGGLAACVNSKSSRALASFCRLKSRS